MNIKELTESQFYMWRTLFALVHADNVIAPEEVRFMAEAFEDVPFTKDQRHILTGDIVTPRNVDEMFEKITDAEDRNQFFKHALELVHIDGEYTDPEKAIILRLQKKNSMNVDFDKLVAEVKLELEDDVPAYGASQKDSHNSGKVLPFLRGLFLQRRTVS